MTNNNPTNFLIDPVKHN